jgi:long-chain acyl-CoA synthetase
MLSPANVDGVSRFLEDMGMAAEGSGSGSVRGLSAVDVAVRGLETAGDRPLLWYFDTPHSGADLARQSDAVACALAAREVDAGDRVALHLQNLPQFVIVLLATWKLGAVAVPINPMLRAAELRSIIDDCLAVALVGVDTDHDAVYRPGLANSSVRTVITTSPLDWLGDAVPAALSKQARGVARGALDLGALVVEYRGQLPVSPAVGENDLAVLIYTSGTTGPSKGRCSAIGTSWPRQRRLVSSLDSPKTMSSLGWRRSSTSPVWYFT